MTPLLIMLHGWGYDRHFWAKLRAALPDIDSVAWDLGFFGDQDRPPPPAGRRLVAIGHSYGLQWLLRERPFAWQSLIAINGFPRFIAGEDFPDGNDPRPLSRMIAAFSAAPDKVVGSFRLRCGDDSPPPQTLNRERLQQSLQHLKDWDLRPAPVDLALCGNGDGVVPPPMSRAAFAPERIVWHQGGHLLPQQDPDWCASQLRAWLAENS